MEFLTKWSLIDKVMSQHHENFVMFSSPLWGQISLSPLVETKIHIHW